jgi:adenylate cyclase
LIAPKVAEHKGRIVKTTGDGLLVEFQSVVEAVACAVELQRDIPTRNDATGEDERIQFRIGINPGDVIVADGGIYGDGQHRRAAGGDRRARRDLRLGLRT